MSADNAAPNLAKQAHATASESYNDMTPEKAIDGARDTRWSAVPGHNAGVWFQLEWDKPVRIGEVVIHQFDRFVMEKDFELAFDRHGGYLRRCVAFGQPLLLEFPTLHVMPTNAPTSPLPNRLSWRLKHGEIKQEGANVRVILEGTYDSFEGGYDFLITPSGEITVHSSFIYTGADVLAREIGLRFSVPKDCDWLQWHRKAGWSVYPPDHIGRPKGETRASAEHDATLPPRWSWSHDNSPMGCNDFRSTKRNIPSAMIRYPQSAGVLIQSDGRQHLRATVETDRISVHVNDWYGGTNAGLWEWEHNYGKGRLIKKGGVIESTVRLRFVQ